MFRSYSRIGASRIPIAAFGGKKQRYLLASWCCFSVCLLVFSGGCGKGVRRSAQHVDVSGQVTHKGKPLPGGQVIFVTDDGFSSNGVIDEKGHYTINAPVGNVKIGVTNTVLTQKREAAMKGAGPRPGGPEPSPIKGTYKQIPSKYYQPDTSGLTYTVTNGPQTHDIVLND